MSEVNPIFTRNLRIVKDLRYWRYIQLGLHDLDQYCRKQALALLQYSIHSIQNNKLLEAEISAAYAGFNLDQKKFEQLWTTFFDVYDTLESFSTHLTKSVWERIELLYSFLKANVDKWQEGTFAYHPLINFKEWLAILNTRGLTHEN